MTQRQCGDKGPHDPHDWEMFTLTYDGKPARVTYMCAGIRLVETRGRL